MLLTLGMAFAIAGVHERRMFHDAMEQLISEKVSFRLNAIRRRAEALPVSDRNDFTEKQYPYRWAGSFRQELRAYVVVGAASFFESTIIKLCGEISEKTDKAWKKPNTNKLKVSKDYLESKGIGAPNYETWKGIIDLQSLRSTLVHCGFYIESETPERLQELCRVFPEIEPDENDGYKLSREICTRALDTVESALRELERSLPNSWQAEF